MSVQSPEDLHAAPRDSADDAARAAEAERAVDAAVELGSALVDAWGSWGPSMTPDATRMAFISDRGGAPEVWVQDVWPHAAARGEIDTEPGHPEPTRIALSDDPVISVHWSAESDWLSCLVATDGGVRTQVWVVRPDGTGARRIAGGPDEHATLGPWSRSGHRVVVSVPGTEPGEPTRSYLADPDTGSLEPLATGVLISVLDLSVGDRLAVLRDGERGHEFCVVVDRVLDEHHRVLHDEAKGSTEVALLRPAPSSDDEEALVAYLVTDAGLPRRQLLAVPISRDGRSGEARVLAARDDAELEFVDADDAGRLLMLVWNVAGNTELELLDTETLEISPVAGLPGLVAFSPVLSRDGGSVILSVEGPQRPRELWHLDTTTHHWARVSDVPRLPAHPLVVPTLELFTGDDGLALTGWLYRVPGRVEPGPVALYLHGGPEGQERPTFSAQHQALVAAGIAVFAPNIRGSSGFGRAFVHADDLHGRWDALADIIAAAGHLERIGVADPARVAVTGRSYGGYATLASLAFSPGVFAAGIDICGMSDMLTFYRDTEPWIAAAAVTKYGHPEHDRELLEAISPLSRAHRIDVPLLVVHGELDTNVPIGEAQQIVAALRALDRPVEYLELAGEGHEYRRADSRQLLIATMLRFLAGAL